MIASTLLDGAQLLAAAPMLSDPGTGTSGGKWSADAALTSARTFLFGIVVVGILAAVVVSMFKNSIKGDNKKSLSTTSSILINLIPIGIIVGGAILGVASGLVNIGGVS